MDFFYYSLQRGQKVTELTRQAPRVRCLSPHERTLPSLPSFLLPLVARATVYVSGRTYQVTQTTHGAGSRYLRLIQLTKDIKLGLSAARSDAKR